MKKTFTLITVLLTLCISITAQEEVSVGAGYSQQAFYSISTGDVTTLPNTAWDIAFSAVGRADGGVFINESASYGEAPIRVFLAQTSDWDEIITDTEVFADSLALSNPEQNWTRGAFNTVRDTASQFDYGWGAYNPETHTLEGNRIFILKKRDGSFFKFQVEKLSRGTYTFKYADLDGENEVTSSISKQDNPGGLVYFSFATNEKVDVPNHDLVFQRYSTLIQTGENSFVPYTVTGVLLAPGVSAAVAEGVDPKNVKEADYADKYSFLPTTIGYDWKSYSFSSGWSIDADRTHFIKNVAGDIYQLTFLDFEGSSTGTTTVERTLISTVPTVDLKEAKSTINIFPNPTSDYVKVASDVYEDITVTLYNVTGQKVKSYTATTNTTLPLVGLPSGIYNVSVTSKTILKTTRLVIK